MDAPSGYIGWWCHDCGMPDLHATHDIAYAHPTDTATASLLPPTPQAYAPRAVLKVEDVEYPDECPNCGSTQYEWQLIMWSTKDAPTGNEPLLVLGCAECRETLVILNDDEVQIDKVVFE